VAVTSADPHALAFAVPTTVAMGLSGYASVLVYAAYASAGNAGCFRRTNEPRNAAGLANLVAKEGWLDVGVETVGILSERLVATPKVVMAGLAKVITDIVIRDEEELISGIGTC